MDKDGLRRRMSALAGPNAADQSAILEHLFAWLSRRLPGTVAAYLAMSDEVDLEALMDRLPGWRWVLPRLEDDGRVTFRDRSVARETHRLGMSQPVAGGVEIDRYEIDVFLVPGLAFDREGVRLGRGGGHYDRILSGRRTDAPAIGVAPPAAIVDSVPHEQHDQRVDWLATVDGVVSCLPTR